jgi:hypothetical protein
VEASTFKSAYENARSEASQYLEPREWASRLILSLRFLALTLALLLSFFDRSQVGVMIPIMHMALIAVAYNVILVLLARHVRWLRQTLNVLVLDTLFTTAAVYLTGGYHSGFFILYFFIIIGAAFYLNLVATTIVAFILGLIYVGACFLNPAGIWTANAAFILAGKVVLLLLVALLCALLVEQLRREHRETERERALSGRLSALNDLFQQLSASLELEPTMQTVVDAPPQGKQIHGLLRIVEQSIKHVLSRQLEAELQESAVTDGVWLHYIPLTGFYGLPLWDLSQAPEMIEEGRRQTEAYLRASQAAARTERLRSLGRDLKARLETAARRLQGNPARKRGGLEEKMNPHSGTFGVRS